MLETAELLKQLPETEQAYRAGKLTERQAIEVASAAVMDRDAEQALPEEVTPGRCRFAPAPALSAGR